MSKGTKAHVKRLQYAVKYETLQKTFWQRIARYYAPNRFEQHCDELEKEIEEFKLQNPKDGSSYS